MSLCLKAKLGKILLPPLPLRSAYQVSNINALAMNILGQAFVNVLQGKIILI